MIEGLRDGRVAMYAKLHHALVDGVSAIRLLQSILTTDPDERNMPAPWAARPRARTARAQEEAEHSLDEVLGAALRQALGLAADAAGMPKAF